MAVNQNDILEIAAVHTYNGVDEVINVWHVRRSVAGSSTESDTDEDIQGGMRDLYTTIESSISSDVVTVELRWRNITQNGPTRFIAFNNTYTGGLGTGDMLPPGVAALLIMRTGTVGVQGKKYLPPFTEPSNNGGTLIGVGAVDMNNLATQVMTGFDGDGTALHYNFVVYSRTLGTAHSLISALKRPTFAYQRRRRAGRGS